ncbi:MAG: tetratricopeptide repeat protein [Candidatus Sericytochromatia bacterium]
MNSLLEIILISLLFTFIFSDNIAKIFYNLEKWSFSLFFYNINPFYRTNNLNLIANCYAEIGDNIKAIEIYNKALKYETSYEIYQNLGLSYVDIGLYDDAYKNFEKAYKDKYINNYNPKNSYTTKFKIRHDIEQFEYLISKGILDDKYNKKIDLYKELETKIDANYDFYYSFDNYFDYDKNVYLYKSEFQGHILNNSLEFTSIQDKYINSKNQIIYFDDFLNPQALEEIRKFCLLSTIWHEYDRKRGYIASYLSNGFNFRLIYQLATELQNSFPKIFKQYNLRNVWAFKYMDNSEGVLIHADEAVINVNFWITPDNSNNDKNSGGMIVYNKKAPKNWSFDKYNTNTDYINKFVNQSDTISEKITYKENRVVIFNSSLFHQTDNFDFKKGYENHRINITLLFGKKS